MLWLKLVVVAVTAILALLYRRGRQNMAALDDARTSALEIVAAVKAGRKAGPEPTLPADPTMIVRSRRRGKGIFGQVSGDPSSKRE